MVRSIMAYGRSNHMLNYELCKGCSILSSCELREYNKQCPCIKCLVKVTCGYGMSCEDFAKFEYMIIVLDDEEETI